jgi:adenylate cyclase
MPQEIERKFLVRGEGWRGLGRSRHIRQGYLCRDPERVVRVRVDDDGAWLTVKGRPSGAARAEFEYAIPRAEADHLLAHLCAPPVVEKTRHEIAIAGLVWEIDEFHHPNRGLVLAEVELPRADFPLTLPDWIGEEVTGQAQYYNQNIGIGPSSLSASQGRRGSG